ncbi:unnamed protein product [Gongylonema pulchrum]|uniref:Threonylcarbamoyladenosine tRNA methylthiotransferase n=1 Tax=Gongylonema pulchrum TaxID=637853 RepID=A0A183EKC1_9BILA|nr:unnamed protein product [Gongylonema pulchrum]
MEDIEDVVQTLPITRSSNHVHIKVRKRLKNSDEVFSGDSFIPGKHKIYIKTWGCTHNTSDSEQMAGLLDAAGHQLTNEKVGVFFIYIEEADLWILNSCTAEPNLPFLEGISIVGVKQLECIVQAVEETLQGNCVRFLSRRKPNSSLMLPKVRKNKYIEILAISDGCLNHCTYCKTKSARGDLVSYRLDDLLERIQNAFAEGCKEVWLTSEDLGAWGRDIGLVLPDLLNAAVECIPDGCMMRLGMTNPPYILDFLEDIARILNHPRVYSFLHIPVQSGSDAVLSDMKREYTCADFCRVADYMIEK